MTADAVVNLLDPETVECPYAAYAALRDDEPVWRDPATGMWVVTRHDDVRTVLLDPGAFSSAVQGRPRTDSEGSAERARRIHEMYDDRGWVPAVSLAGRDGTEHKELRSLYDHAFRPAKVKGLDPFVEETAERLLDDLVAAETGDWVQLFAVPLPLTVIGRQMGVGADDLGCIKAWTDAWVRRLGMMQTDEEALESTKQEIEAQHYFQPIFEHLRRQPDDTLLSDMVNAEVPGWGRPLDDEELHAAMMADTFVAGAETTTSALSAGMLLLAEEPGLWERLRADPDALLPRFIEEVIRLEGPVQGLFRIATADIELHGVTIPAGAMVNVRYAAANRDDRAFARPDQLDLGREQPRSHLGFGIGPHYCLGAALARRELLIGFRVTLRRLRSVRVVEGANDFRHHPNVCLRSLRELHLHVEAAV